MRPVFADRRLRARFQIDRRPNDKSVRAGVIAIAAIAIGIGLAGCGSDTKSEPTREGDVQRARRPRPAKPRRTSPTQAAGPNKTIVDYIKENGIIEAPVNRGDPGSPTIDLPFPPGWEDAGPRTPEWAYGAIVFSDPAMAQDPPTIIALVSKLTGNVDPAKILEFAPGEIKNLPGYEGAATGSPSTLGGFDATADRRHLHQGRRQARHRAEDRRDPGPGRAVRPAAQRRRRSRIRCRVDGRDERHRRADHDHAV